ncbi:ATP-binding cassette domain-containing protein [Enterococcus sp. DIV0086]|uniref:ATP-binding cassette domain-containing protein n=1 Tax=Enterococcus sp. DIV0086 TaxID=2774655 RepID=UPI003D2B4A0C
MGPNGSGKSTLMNIICGLVSPTSGEVTYDLKDKNRLFKQLGYLPQTCNFYPDFTVFDFLYYMSTLKGIHDRDIDKKIILALKKVNLDSKQYSKINSLSGGMQRRLGIAQAIINNPQILILDEPTTGLDPKERVSFKRLISDLGTDKIVIISTHIVSDVEDMADNIIFLKKGNVVLTGTHTSVLKTIEDKVWIAIVDQNEAKQFEERYVISKTQHLPNKYIQYRIISDSKPCSSAKQVFPTLEDVYLSIFNQGSGE